jgi:hypothetical protein
MPGVEEPPSGLLPGSVAAADKEELRPLKLRQHASPVRAAATADNDGGHTSPSLATKATAAVEPSQQHASAVANDDSADVAHDPTPSPVTPSCYAELRTRVVTAASAAAAAGAGAAAAAPPPQQQTKAIALGQLRHFSLTGKDFLCEHLRAQVLEVLEVLEGGRQQQQQHMTGWWVSMADALAVLERDDGAEMTRGKLLDLAEEAGGQLGQVLFGYVLDGCTAAGDAAATATGSVTAGDPAHGNAVVSVQDLARAKALVGSLGPTDMLRAAVVVAARAETSQRRQQLLQLIGLQDQGSTEQGTGTRVIHSLLVFCMELCETELARLDRKLLEERQSNVGEEKDYAGKTRDHILTSYQTIRHQILSADLLKFLKYIRTHGSCSDDKAEDLMMQGLGCLGLEGLTDEINRLSESGKELLTGAIGEVAEVEGFRTLMLELLMPMFGLLKIPDMRKAFVRYPAANDRATGERLLSQYPQWKYLLRLNTWMDTTNKNYVSFCFFCVYFLSCMWILPGQSLVYDEESGQFATPQSATAGWAIRSWIFWAIKALLPFGLLKNAQMVQNNARLEVCGALYRHLESFYGKQSAIMHPIQKQLQSTSWINFWLAVGCILFGLASTGWFYLGIKFADTGDPLWIISMAFLWLIIAVSLTSIFATVVLVSSTCDLLSRNVEAYGELLQLLCMQVHAVANQQQQQQQQHGDTAGPPLSTVTAVGADPLVRQLRSSLTEFEEFLIQVTGAVKEGFAVTLSTLYAFMLVGYFLILFYLYVSFLEVQNGASMDKNVLMSAVGITVGAVLSVLAIAQPLLRMGLEASSWSKVCAQLKTAKFEGASVLLSATHDPDELWKHHTKLMPFFTWEICGQQMTFGAIYSAVSSVRHGCTSSHAAAAAHYIRQHDCARFHVNSDALFLDVAPSTWRMQYFVAVWISVILPALEKFKDDLQSKLEDAAQDVNATLG